MTEKHDLGERKKTRHTLTPERLAHILRQTTLEKIWDQLSEPDRETTEMAFSALEKQIPKELSNNSPELDSEFGDLQPTCNQLATDCISRQEAVDAVKNADVVVLYHDVEPVEEAIEEAIEATKRSITTDIEGLPSALPTLYGYDIKHLMLIAYVLRKENLPPERVFEAVTDIGRIVSIVRDEFEESLRKAVEQCKI